MPAAAHAPLQASLAEIAGVPSSKLPSSRARPAPTSIPSPPSRSRPTDAPSPPGRSPLMAAAWPGGAQVTGGAAALIVRALAQKTKRRIVAIAITADA